MQLTATFKIRMIFYWSWKIWQKLIIKSATWLGTYINDHKNSGVWINDATYVRNLQEGNILGIFVLQFSNRTKVLWRKYLTLILTLLLFLFCTSSTFNPNCGPKAYKDKFFLAFLQAAKRECDKIIDKNGPPPVGKKRKKNCYGEWLQVPN